MEKFTKMDYFNRILSYAHEEDKPFILHEMELLEKKNASRSTRMTAKQVANATIADAIYAAMVDGKQYTIDDIKGLVAELADANPQKVSAIVTKMRNEVRVSRETIKGRAYFTKI